VDHGYHCDLILVPEAWQVETVRVGSYVEWGDGTLPVSSDHAPVVADLRRAEPPAASRLAE
jgi:endonuclease/exonuclease/phosphatase family metal-dependent hydrolase